MVASLLDENIESANNISKNIHRQGFNMYVTRNYLQRTIVEGDKIIIQPKDMVYMFIKANSPKIWNRQFISGNKILKVGPCIMNRRYYKSLSARKVVTSFVRLELDVLCVGKDSSNEVGK